MILVRPAFLLPSPRHARPLAAFAAALVLAASALPAQARNVRLMESVPDAVRSTRTHDILGNLELRWGGDSGRGATVVRRDVVVKGVGATKLDDVGDDDRVRPRDHELCARAFEDAMTKLAFAARGARATAIVGVVSDYDGTPFDDPVHYECHVGALKAAVTLRAQLVRGPLDAVVPPPTIVQPTDPVVVVPPTPVVPLPASAPTFQPLPPVPAPSN